MNQYAIGLDVYGRGEDFDPTTDSIVRVEAGRLRSKLTQYYATLGNTDKVIISLPKGGYAVAIEVLEDLQADGAQSPPTIQFPLRYVLTVLSVFAVAAYTLVSLVPHSNQDTAIGVSEVFADERGRNAPAIAVLPFDNMSADPEQDYFSDGITEDIITDLSTLPGLTVIARNSTFVYKNQPTSIRTIARELGVSHVLEGSVRRERDRVRITAQLIDVETEAHIWADRYDRAIDDVFEIQEEVSLKIVAALELVLPNSEEPSLDVLHTPNVLAHDAFLRGKEQFYRFNKDGVLRAVDLFSLAIERDPNFAEAYAWKSRALVFSFISGFIPSKEMSVDKALKLAERSIELNGALPSANAILAWAKRWNQEFTDAEMLINRATELNPNFADAFLWKSLILSTVGKGDEALEAIEQSNRLNPNYGATSIFAVGRAKFELGEFDQAVQAFNRGIERNPNFLPNHTFKLFALEQTGDLDGAIAAKAMMAQINPNYERSASYLYYLEERE